MRTTTLSLNVEFLNTARVSYESMLSELKMGVGQKSRMSGQSAGLLI